jgi:DNA invertase Pin-like site-specific DNA recombinase
MSRGRAARREQTLPGQLSLFGELDPAGEAEVASMGRFAELRREYLRERRPQLYRELRAAGRLESYCRECAEEARRQVDSLLAMGWSDDRAEEWVRADLADQ